MSNQTDICFLRPPPNLLRQETEGTQLYLAVLNKTAAETGDEATDLADNEVPVDSNKDEATLKGEAQQLREDAERQLVSFCGHILKEVATAQPGLSDAVQADSHRALALRSPVTVQV